MPHIDIGTGVAVFGAAFACWAWVVAWGVTVMRREFADLKTQVMQLNAQQNAHIMQTERRLTMLETEFNHLAKPRFQHVADTD